MRDLLAAAPRSKRCPFAGRRRTGSFLGRGAREGLPQALNGAGEAANLLGKPLGFGLLRGEQALHGLQLILNDLQLVDRFLLRRLQARPVG